MPGHVSLDFMAVSSYAKGTTTSGEVRLLKDLDTALDGRNVVIVEDIVDTGLTLTYLQEILRAPQPEVAADRVPAEQAVAPQGRREGRLHRLHDRGSVRRRLRPRLRRAVPQPAAHRACSEPVNLTLTQRLTCDRLPDLRGEPRSRPRCTAARSSVRTCRSRISTLPFTIVVRTSSPRVT